MVQPDDLPQFFFGFVLAELRFQADDDFLFLADLLSLLILQINPEPALTISLSGCPSHTQFLLDRPLPLMFSPQWSIAGRGERTNIFIRDGFFEKGLESVLG